MYGSPFANHFQIPQPLKFQGKFQQKNFSSSINVDEYNMGVELYEWLELYECTIAEG